MQVFALLFKVVLFEYAYTLNIFNRNVKFDKYNYLNFNNNFFLNLLYKKNNAFMYE